MQVPHTNDLTALALTSSSLHGIVTPLIYSRFDIVWPDALNMTEPRTGVDALTYGLATLVMREDIFENAMLEKEDPGHGACQSFACKDCGNINYVNKAKPARLRKLRRGNFFSQFTKKFSLGNGPPDLVQEYLVTKEGGKMLGTLVALSIARMPNLETFVWDMPTGILRDIWISLGSLGDYQPSKLQNVFIRFHDNTKALEDSGLVRSSSTGNQPSLPLSATHQNTPQLPAGSANLMGVKLIHSNHHVESPNFSILPPLRSVSAIAIDELANLDELSVLVGRSIEKLRELKVGMSPEMHTSGHSSDSKAMKHMLNGGTLAVLFSAVADVWRKPFFEPFTDPNQVPSIIQPHPPTTTNDKTSSTPLSNVEVTESTLSITPNPTAADSMNPLMSGVNTASIDPALTQASISNADQEDRSPRQHQSSEIAERNLVHRPKARLEVASSPPREETDSVDVPPTKDTGLGLSNPSLSPSKFKLEALALEHHTLNVFVLRRAIDWSYLTSLTLLLCVDTDALWSALRTQYAPLARPRSLILSIPTVPLDKKPSPHPRLRRMPSSPNPPHQIPPTYRLHLRHLHTNTVSAPLLTFLKETLAPHTLQSLFLQDHPDYLSIVTPSQIYKGPLKRHRLSLTKFLLDSSHGPPQSRTRSVSARKWMLNRECLSQIIAPQRMPKLRELSISLEYKDWHFFLQQLPNVRGLRSLHIPYIADHVYGSNLSLRELAMGVVDVINLRQECELSYLGVGSKCFEIVETRIRKPNKKRRSGSEDGEGAHGHEMDDSSSEASSLNEDSEAHDEEEEESDDGQQPQQQQQHGAGTGTTDAAAATVPAGNVEEDEGQAGAVVEEEEATSEEEEVMVGKQVKMKLREILFYDDKISIFKARHGKL